MASANGSSRITWWIITVLSSVLLGSGSGYVAMSSAHSARLAVLEAQRLDDHQQLERMERKIDKLLEKQR